MEMQPKQRCSRGSEEIVSLILDEIALEGLEGITLQGMIQISDCWSLCRVVSSIL